MSTLAIASVEIGAASRKGAVVAKAALACLVDAAVTYWLVRGYGFHPLLARAPGFVATTVVTFALRDGLNFVESPVPLVRDLASRTAKFAVDWAAYTLALWIALDPLRLSVRAEALPLFVAFGAVVAASVAAAGSRLSGSR